MKSSLEKCQRECGFSNLEWSDFMKTVKDYSIDPANHIGLEGFMVHKKVWEEWLDVFLDTRIGKQYWGILKGKKWIYGRDREVIRKHFRKVVMLIGNSLRRKRGLGQFSINEERLEDDKHSRTGDEEDGRAEEGEEYSKQPRTKSEENNMSSDLPHMGPPLKWTTLNSVGNKETSVKEGLMKGTEAKRPKGRSVWTTDDNDGDSDSDYQPPQVLPKRLKSNNVSTGYFGRKSHVLHLSLMNQDNKPAVTKKFSTSTRSNQGICEKDNLGVVTTTAGKDNLQITFESKNTISPIAKVYSTIESNYLPSTTQLSPMIFRTRAANHFEVEYKLVYTENAPSLPVFLEKVHRKHRLEKEQRISSLQVKIDNEKYRIDLDEPEKHCDWHVVTSLLKNNEGPIEVVLDIT